jgi:hypothetical protein
MSSGNRLFDPNSGMHAQAPHHWNRRDFVKGVAALAGTAGISVYDMKTAAAEPSPEKTNLTLIENPVTCIVPTYIAAELLHAEGFTDVRFRKFPSETKLWPPDGLASEEFDIALTFIPTDIVQIDSGSPIVVLAGSHTGCVELVASNRVRTTKDLRGRRSDSIPTQKISLQCLQHTSASTRTKTLIGAMPRIVITRDYSWKARSMPS